MFKKKGGRGKRTMKRRGRGMKTRIPRSQLGLNPAVQNKNYAMITETVQTATLSANQPYIAQVAISQFLRARAVAACFKFYRLKKVVYDYTPDANTYQAGDNATTETVPYLYYFMNRDASSNSSLNVQQFQAAGCRAIKFTKKIVIAYKPNLIKANQLIQRLGTPTAPQTQSYNGMNSPVYDQWISTKGLQNQYWDAAPDAPLPTASQGNITNPNQVPYQINVLPYYGHNFYFQQTHVDATAAAVGFGQITCYWEFKDPVFYTAGSSVQDPEPEPIIYN